MIATLKRPMLNPTTEVPPVSLHELMNAVKNNRMEANIKYGFFIITDLKIDLPGNK